MRIRLTDKYYLNPCGTSTFDIIEEVDGVRGGVKTKTPYARAYGLPLELAVEKVMHLTTREEDVEYSLQQFLDKYKAAKEEILKSLKV